MSEIDGRQFLLDLSSTSDSDSINTINVSENSGNLRKWEQKNGENVLMLADAVRKKEHEVLMKSYAGIVERAKHLLK